MRLGSWSGVSGSGCPVGMLQCAFILRTLCTYALFHAGIGFNKPAGGWREGVNGGQDCTMGAPGGAGKGVQRQPLEGSGLKSCQIEGQEGDQRGLRHSCRFTRRLPPLQLSSPNSHPGRCCSEQLAGSLSTGSAILGDTLPGPLPGTSNTQLSPCPGLLALSPQSSSSPRKLGHHVPSRLGEKGTLGQDSIRGCPGLHTVQVLLGQGRAGDNLKGLDMLGWGWRC